ncbi:MAG: hypothetical protein RLZZ405_279 [Verrucomicrobiota bacterium]|jgi:uncharacterized protein with beta-barrel porin domain
MKQSRPLGLRSLLAAALLAAVASPAPGAELNYSADDLGAGRFIVDLYTATDIGLGAGTWTYGNRPVVMPVLVRNISGIQQGSVNFLNYRNSALVQSATGVSNTIRARPYQDGIGVDDLMGANIFGFVVIPNVSIYVESLGTSMINYNLYNPNAYDAVLNVSDATVSSLTGRAAIHADAFVDLTVNLDGSNRVNGAIQASRINIQDGVSTFNGSIAGSVLMSAGTGAVFTSLATTASGGIDSVGGGQSLSFRGGNTVNGGIRLGADSAIELRGAGIVFNGDVEAAAAGFLAAGSLALGDGVTLRANFNFNGNNATLSLGDGASVRGNVITTAGQSGVLEFSGAGTVFGHVGVAGALSAVNVLSTGADVITGSTKATQVSFLASGTLAMVGGLDTRLQDGVTLGSLRFANNSGEAQFGAAAANVEVRANITTDTAGNGDVKVLGGTAHFYGSFGSAAYALRRLDVGGVGSARGLDGAVTSAELILHTDAFVGATRLNGGSSYLGLAAGRSITGDSIAAQFAGQGILDLMGGTQSASFTSGGIGLLGTIGTIEAGHVAGDVATFDGDVRADNLHVHDGVANFRDQVVAVNATVDAGTIDFNGDGGTTSIANRLTFLGAGTVNFREGANVGMIDFGGVAGTVNVASGRNLVGDVRNVDLISSVADGTLNFLGGFSQLSGSVGSAAGNASIALLDVGKDATAQLAVSGDIFAAEIRLSRGSTLVAAANITGDIVTTVTGMGSLVLTNGNQTVAGNIGSAGARLASATVAATGTTTNFNGSSPSAGVSYVNLVTFAGDGTLVLNGANGGAAASGLIGAVDFTSGGEGVLAVGSGVNLTFGAGGIGLQNANLATLDFLGNSTVVGQIGAPAGGLVLAGSTPGDIRAGANGSVVNFGGPVYVSGTTFHVVGTGTVNFADDLVGPLVYEAAGTVNFNDTKRVVGVVTTTNDNQGVLNYLGSTTLAGSIGTAANRLAEVRFHTDTTQASSAQSLGHDIFSVDTILGNTGVVSGNPTATVATLTANIHLGTTVTLADASTTLYASGAQTLVGGTSVDFFHAKNVNGALSLGTISRSTFGASLRANGGTLGFAVAATPFTTPAGANGLVDPAASSLLTGLDVGSSLALTGNETIQVSFLGSLRANVSATLVDVAGGPTGAQAGTLRDNSFTIDTSLRRVNGDLVVTTSRDALTYVTKSASLGSRGDALAIRLGALAAAGTGYSASLATVFNKLDLDQWGYGNNAANLARQLQLLTPAGDGAAVQASFGLTSQAIGTVLDASADLATKHASGNDFWVRGFGGRQNRDNGGEYAGFRTNLGGAVVGTDRVFGDVVAGLALGYGAASVTSAGLRAGDEADVNSTIAGLYVRVPVGKYFLNAMVNGAQHSTSTDRQTAVGARAQGEYDGDELGGTLQFGRRFPLSSDGASLTPILTVDYARYHQEAYAETGAGDIGLRYGEQAYAQSSASLMFRFSKESKLGEGMAGVWNAYLGYRRLLTTPTYDSTVSFVGDTESFVVGGWQDGVKGSLTGGLSYDYNPRAGVTYSLRYDAETKSGFNIHTLGLRATWAY